MAENSGGSKFDWLIGVLLMFLGSILTNLGNNLMSLGHTQSKENDRRELELEKELENQIVGQDVEKKEPPKTWWFMGTVIFVFGSLIVFLSFGFAAQSLLAALESVQFVSNVFFARYIHGEKITKRIIWSTVAIVIGNILVVLFSQHSSIRLTGDQIAYIYLHNSAFHIYLIVSGVVFFICYYVWLVFSNARLKRDTFYWRHTSIEPFTFILYMSLIGTQAVLHSKNLSMLMQHCIQGENQFATPWKFVIWGELVIWIFAAYLYVNRINLGLSLYPPVFFIPVQAVCFAFFTIICGGIFFDEFNFTTNQTICFTIGILLIFCGVVALAPSEVSFDCQVLPYQSDQVLSCCCDDDMNAKIVEKIHYRTSFVNTDMKLEEIDNSTIPTYLDSARGTRVNSLTNDESSPGNNPKPEGEEENFAAGDDAQLSSLKRAPSESSLLSLDYLRERTDSTSMLLELHEKS